MIMPFQENPTTNQHLIDSHPFRGLGLPEDIAQAVLFLSSDDARWVCISLPYPLKIWLLLRCSIFEVVAVAICISADIECR